MDERFLSRLAGVQRHAHVEPFCLNCGYDMRGTPSGRCPECGVPFVRQGWERAVDEILGKVEEADEAASFVSVALVFALLGVVLRMGALGWGGVGSGLATVGRVLGAMCGGIDLLFLLGLFRVRGLPEWAQARRRHQPSSAVVLTGAFVGLLLIMTAILAPW